MRIRVLRFHLETTPENTRNLIENCADEMTPGPFIQDAGAMLVQGHRFVEANRAMARLLDGLVASA